jgi:hypothetical protein
MLSRRLLQFVANFVKMMLNLSILSAHRESNAPQRVGSQGDGRT